MYLACILVCPVKIKYIGDRDTFKETYLEPYMRARLDARWGNAFRASLAALGALAGALGATAATAAPLPPFCFLAGLGGSFRRRPVAVALAATALASAFGVAMTKQKMEELLGAGCDGDDPLQHKEQMGGLIGALHTR
jgi:hypothetical protein